MLRFLLATLLRLLIVCAGIGLLVSKQWGWSEYASKELYLIYAQAKSAQSAPYPFVMVNTDGSGEQWTLAANDETLAALACSPDGRTLAYLTSSGHLSVVNQAGTIFDRALGQGYDAISAANNGTVAVTQQTYGIDLVVSARNSYLPLPPDHIAYDPIVISSAGVSLWPHTGQGGIKVLARSGQKLMTVAHAAVSPRWLASEQMFVFLNQGWPGGGTGGLADTTDHLVVWLRHSNIPGILSPDATRQVIRFSNAGSIHEQLGLIDPLTGHLEWQLTSDAYPHTPLCFLTFRPQMLIGGG